MRSAADANPPGPPGLASEMESEEADSQKGEPPCSGHSSVLSAPDGASVGRPPLGGAVAGHVRLRRFCRCA